MPGCVPSLDVVLVVDQCPAAKIHDLGNTVSKSTG
jgi:hypothetical protein